MRKYILVFILTGVIGVAAQARLYNEPIFGLDLPVDRWGYLADEQYFGAPATGSIGIPGDAANLRFVSVQDTTDIILILDRLSRQIRWLRTPAGGAGRPLERIGCFGVGGDSIGQFLAPQAIAVASRGPYYNPATDRVYIADRMNHRIVKLAFAFYPDSPQSDEIVWESSCFVDSEFYPTSLRYIDFHTGNININKLVALDDIKNRLVVFSHNGSLLTQISLVDPADTVYHIYSSFAVKLNQDTTASLYLADRANRSIRQYRISRNGGMQFVNELSIGSSYEIMLEDLVFLPSHGLWATDCEGPHLYHIAEDLSGIIREIGLDDFDGISLFHPYKVILFPERLIVFERTEDATGIITFAFNPPSARRDNEIESDLPREFSLSQNYPNPFNPSTSISFGLPYASPVRLEVFDILGRRVRVLADDLLEAGYHSIVWDGKDSHGIAMASGLYLYRLVASDYRECQKMLLLK